jgi:hypothetical protein
VEFEPAYLVADEVDERTSVYHHDDRGVMISVVGDVVLDALGLVFAVKYLDGGSQEEVRDFGTVRASVPDCHVLFLRAVRFLLVLYVPGDVDVGHQY